MTIHRASSHPFVCRPARANGTVAAATTTKPATVRIREPVDVASGDEAGHEGADALRDERDAGAERGGAAHVLVKQRQQEHRAVREKPEKNRTALAEPTDRSSGLNTGVMRRDCEGAETRMRAKGLPRGWPGRLASRFSYLPRGCLGKAQPRGPVRGGLRWGRARRCACRGAGLQLDSG
jgi:hypothetical protein